MLEVIHVDQGSDEWHDLRTKYHRTASRTPVVMGVSEFSNWEKLAQELKFGVKPYYSQAMRRGNDLEPMVKDMVEKHFNDIFATQVGVTADFLASLDGISFDGETIIEIKVSPTTYQDVKRGEIPEMYRWQMIHQMYVFGAKKAYLCAYNHETDDLAISEPVYDNPPAFFEMLAKWEEFEAFMETYEMPDAPIERTDTEWEMLALKLREIKDRKAEIEAEEKEYKEALLALAGEHKTKGFGVTVFPKKNKTLDKNKLIAENNIDTDKYMKESVSWSVKVS